MKNLLPLLMLIFSACNNHGSVNKEKSEAAISTTASSPNLEVASVNCNYESSKNVCKRLLASQPNSLPQFIADSLLPCWYGTAWDFNGCSVKPNKGKIACGYFVTTVLRDAGLKINRVKMATCPSSTLIKNMCTQIKIYSNQAIEDFVKEVKLKQQGLYIVGLDQHTGFIYYDGAEVYFIHASYISPRLVVKEKAIESQALIQSKMRMLGKVKI